MRAPPHSRCPSINMSTNERLISADELLPPSMVVNTSGKTQVNFFAEKDTLSQTSPINSISSGSSATEDGINGPLPLGVDPSQRRRMPAETGFKLGDPSIDEDRPFKVVVIGAGFSGVIAGIRYSVSFRTSVF